MNVNVKRIDNFKVGDKEFFSKTISESDVYLYAGVTGDLAPHHVNAHYAKGTRFKERIAHGLLIAGVMSSALTKLAFSVQSGSLFRIAATVSVNVSP